jgi:hypothetical protein
VLAVRFARPTTTHPSLVPKEKPLMLTVPAEEEQTEPTCLKHLNLLGLVSVAILVLSFLDVSVFRLVMGFDMVVLIVHDRLDALGEKLHRLLLLLMQLLLTVR